MQSLNNPFLKLRKPTSNLTRTPAAHATSVPVSIVDGMLAGAIKLQLQHNLPEAERIYRRILRIDPRHAATLHMLGTLAHEVGRDDVAVQLICSAIDIDAGPASYHSNLGTILQAQGNLDEAGASYMQAISRNPNLAEAHMNLGTVLAAQDKPEQAARRFEHALTLNPNLAEAHMNLGNILQSEGRSADALACHDRALALKPDFAEACFNRGNALLAQGAYDEAVASYRKALDLKPGMPEAHGNMGNARQAQQRLDEAVDCYERALALKRDYAEAHYNLGNARQAQNLLAEAAACYERALALKPHLAEAHYNLGNTRQAQDDPGAAAACFRNAIAFNPGYAEAHYNLGCVLQQQGRLPEALAHLGHAIHLKPDYAQARFGLALAQIQNGDFVPGWRNYVARWHSPDHDTPRRAYDQPLWNGERLLSGRLLLWGEQGIGDEIMFAGIVPDASKTGNAITLECDPRLVPLFARSFPEVEVVPARQPVIQLTPKLIDSRPLDAKPESFAAQLPTGSLPGLFRRTASAFAIGPFLKPDSAAHDRFRTRYADGRLVAGLAWQTRNLKTGARRSIDLSLFALPESPLFALPDIRWISLQYGDFDALEAQAAAAQPHSFLANSLLIDRSVDQFADIDLFAAQISALDLIITIDNSTAHLAGALGVPVWLMLPFAADWRWLKDRSDSPWYPSMRIFRQPAAGNWQAVATNLFDALAFTLAGPRNSTGLSRPPSLPMIGQTHV
jgi:tetratricopeptide (TPR) repeat protein